ncbi:MAG: class I SAM-dependent methyltransferase [Desulfuromonadaceae bacterium]|nr:class I SAM-dependent methyltransferase [Desulfuromonadaceae bacterium]MDD5104161.1 class I SAM-dependent methyltransferase [Desulfuromonadaceae bacterium]
MKIEYPDSQNSFLAEKTMLAAVEASGGIQTETEARALYRIAFSLPEGAQILEIGSYLGASTTALGHGIMLRRSALYSLYCLDSWQDYEKQGFYAKGIAPPEASDIDILSSFIHTTSFMGEQLRILKGTSSQFAPLLPSEFFDMVFVDGAHDYENVFFDINLALRIIKPSGLICGHDYHSDGLDVVRAVDELIYKDAGITTKGIFPGTSIWYAIAPGQIDTK